jgi:nucleoside-diphosphate-sugar epimerase
MKVLVTGCAGFIGWKVCELLLDMDYEVVGLDNLNDYYDVRLKEWRLESLRSRKNFRFYRVDVEDLQGLREIFNRHRFDAVINEAARAGVRYSLQDPWVYMRTNAYGTLNLLELMKDFGVRKFVLASTSSLYAGQPMPFREDLPVNTPISPYAASKKAAEVLAYTYHHLYGIDVTVLRYFTVYGPAGRPDMSVFRFIYWTLKGEPVEVFGDGSQSRDFTYIDDIAEGTVRALRETGYEIVNLGGNRPHSLKELLELVERFTGRKVRVINRDFHRADLRATWADIGKAKRVLRWEPKVNLEEGIRRTVEWFKENWGWVRDLRVR